ncbi:DUF2071 domain-containing protein [Streptomyces sp. NPDC101237]|uniref:DUF2071 domain-containing protein n=1 Tax=Streptomyces sp. NPDC101237 TaxID=3366139 RepID=UPI0037F4408C
MRTGPPIAEPSPLEHFLTARWGLHTTWHGHTLHQSADHPPWPPHRAELLGLDDGLMAAAGPPAPAGPPGHRSARPGRRA